MTEADISAAIVAGLRQIAPEADPSSLRPEERIREALDIDSFDFLTFLIKLHEKLGVEIPESDYGKLNTLEAMTTYLCQAVKKKNGV